MLNKTLLILSFLIFIQISDGQNFNLAFTSIEKVNIQTTPVLYNITHNSKLFTASYSGEKEIELTIRNTNDLNVIAKRLIIGGRNSTDQCLSNNFRFKGLFRLGDRIYLFVDGYEKTEKKLTLLAQEISDSGDFIGNLKSVDHINLERLSNKVGFSLLVSSDTTKLIVISSPPYHKNKNEQFLFKILDQDLKSLSKVSIDLPYKDNDFHSSKCILTPNGNIIFSGYYDVDKRTTERDMEDAKMVYYIIDPSGNHKVFEVSVPKLELTNMNMQLAKDNNTLWINGLYSDLTKGNNNEKHGIITVKIDVAKKTVLSKKITPFSKNIIAKARNEKEQSLKTKDGIDKYFRSRDYLINNDGSMWALIEEKYEIHTKTGTIYYFLETIAFLLDSNGDIEKSIYIPKFQIMGWLSYDIGHYYTYHNGDDLILFINDHKDNISIESKTDKGVKKATNSTNSNLFSITIKHDGSYTKSVMYDNKKDFCLTGRNIKLDDNNIIFEVRTPGMGGNPRPDKRGFCKLSISNN